MAIHSSEKSCLQLATWFVLSNITPMKSAILYSALRPLTPAHQIVIVDSKEIKLMWEDDNWVLVGPLIAELIPKQLTNIPDTR